MPHFLHTIGVLLLLSAAYFPYAWSVGFLLQSDSPAPQVDSAAADVMPAPNSARQPLENERVARENFPDQDWLLDAKIQLRDVDDHFYAYSNQWEQSDAKLDVRFTPFAMVTMTKDGPLSVLAQSAVVKFEREIDFSSPNPGRILEARLEGDVRIRGANNLEVQGRHFVYSTESARIWSVNPVKLAFDQHRAESDHGLQIDLSLDSTSQQRTLAINDVKSVHLLRHVVMHLAMPEGDGSHVTPVKIECAGSFRLDRRDNGATAVAVFEDKVVVQRQLENGSFDYLKGQTLDVTFTRNAASAPQEAASNAASGATPTLASRVQYRPTLMVVRGAPAIFHSDEQQAHATMGYARYDAVQRVLAMSSSMNNPTQLRRVNSQATASVHLKQGHSEMEAEQIGLKHDEERRVQEIVCRGAGWLTRLNPESGQKELSVTWSKQLRKYQDVSSPQDVIDVSGNVVVEQFQQAAKVTANYIKLWMDPLALQSLSSGKSGGKPEMPQIRRILAIENVTIRSPRLEGNTSQLQIWFDNVAFKSSPNRSDEASEATKLDASIGRARIRRTAGGGDEIITGAETDADAETPPVVVDAKVIRVLIVGRGPERTPDLGEIWSEGNVVLTQQREGAIKPMTIKAQQLHVKSDGESKQVVHLIGEPAKLDDPQMDLQGREIFVDRHRNLVWVDGQGELKLPIDRSFDGKQLTTPTNLSITWNEQMVFDGLMATFTGRVVAGMLDSTMKCQQMEVRMKQRVLFEQGAAGIEKDPISTIVCRKQVEFDSRLIVDSSLNQVRKGVFAAFAMNLKTGRAEAKGPATIQIWRRGQGKIAGLTPQAVVGSNQATRVKEGGWDFTQVMFADEMIGLRDQRSTTCKGNVKVVYGPVAEPLETFDLDKLPKDTFLVSCDRLQMTQPEGRSQTGKEMIELVAEGNAWLEGRSFSGQADVISYDSAKDLFMLRSLGENDSELTRELRPGGNRIPTIAKTIQFIRSTNMITIDKVRFSNGLQ